MNDLVTRINGLSREESLEAARYIGSALEVSADKVAKERVALQPLTEQPYAHLADIEALARLLLLTAAANPDYQPALKKALDGAGMKQFILGGAEIVAISATTLYALQLVITKGKEAEEHIVTITEEGGKKTVEMRNSVRYGIGPKLADILGGYFGLKK
jgi:hypothetical protein